MMRVSLVHNPRSGANEQSGEHLIQLLKGFGHQVHYYLSKEEWRGALDSRPDLVAVAGGDGTVSEVARAVAGLSVPIAVLPMGTANNIARTLGLGAIPTAELVAGWPDASLHSFDLGLARGPWGIGRFLESVGAGLLSDTMAEIDSGGSAYVNQLDGSEARIAAALEVCDRILSTADPVNCEVSLDGRDMSGEYVLVEVLNFGAAGPNLHLAPYADASDGLLDVVLVDDSDRQLLSNQLSMYRSDPTRAPALPIHQTHHDIRNCGQCKLHLDDDLWINPGSARSVVEASVETNALRFLVPPGAIRRNNQPRALVSR